MFALVRPSAFAIRSRRERNAPRGLIQEDENMDANAEVFVTLSADLLDRLRKAAEKEHIPLRWLVAGLVCDTVEADQQRTGTRLTAAHA
jgi:hypothetical protein